MKLLRLLKRRRQRERELDDEIRGHLAMAVRERIEQGENPAKAEANARREFGNATLVKEVTRDMWGWRWLETLLQDLRYALRQLHRNPGFTAVAVLTLALGIGANAAIFSILDPLLLRDLPVYKPQELVCISSAGTLGNAGQGYSSEVAAYNLYRDHARAFSGIAAYTELGAYSVNAGGVTSTVAGEIVSGNYFTVLGIRPYWGSFFTRKTSQEGNPAVLSYQYWQRAFNGDRNAVGKVIEVDKATYTIRGVVPLAFFGTEVGKWPDIYLSLDGRLPDSEKPGADWVTIFGRLKPGVTLAQAKADLIPLFKQYVRRSMVPEVEVRESIAHVVLTPAPRGLSELRQRFALPALILMAVVGLILLIACANVANLSLAFGASRRREIAVRLAVGAGRWRLVRLLLAQAALVAMAGATAGLLAARWTAAILAASLSTAASPVVLNTGLGAQALMFTVGVTVLTIFLAGLVPALSSTRVSLTEELKISPGSGLLSARSRLGNGLLIAQVAICVILLAGAGLLLHTLLILETFNPGFDRNHVLAVALESAARGRDAAQENAFYTQLLDRVKSLPGVRAAAYAALLPISGREIGINIEVEGYTLGRGETANTLFDEVSPGYFKAMGIPLLMGRDFSQQDARKPFHVAVINQTMARRFFGSTDPVGKHFRTVEGRHTLEIIGVVADSKYNSLRESPQDFFYVPITYGQTLGRTLDVRAAGNLAAIAGTVRKLIQSYGGRVKVASIHTLREDIEESLHQDRLVSALCGVFAVIALTLACVGLYGVLSFGVARRTHEIGIRVALGARPGDIFWMVTGQGVRLAVIGLGLGIIGAMVLTRYLSSLLYGVKRTDPLTFLAVSVVLISVALLACYIPARRATKVDPLVALRYE
jgi:predicted permease